MWTNIRSESHAASAEVTNLQFANKKQCDRQEPSPSRTESESQDPRGRSRSRNRDRDRDRGSGGVTHKD